MMTAYLNIIKQSFNTLSNTVITWIDGLFKWPRFEVVCLGSCPKTIILALINLKASITTCKTRCQINSFKNKWRCQPTVDKARSTCICFWPISRKSFNYNINKKNLLLIVPSVYHPLSCNVRWHQLLQFPWSSKILT